jgi:hypothetical protein
MGVSAQASHAREAAAKAVRPCKGSSGSEQVQHVSLLLVQLKPVMHRKLLPKL